MINYYKVYIKCFNQNIFRLMFVLSKVKYKIRILQRFVGESNC